MKQYFFKIYARMNDAIGDLHYDFIKVQALDYDSAVLKLYDTHEHITVIDYSEWDIK